MNGSCPKTLSHPFSGPYIGSLPDGVGPVGCVAPILLPIIGLLIRCPKQAPLLVGLVLLQNKVGSGGHEPIGGQETDSGIGLEIPPLSLEWAPRLLAPGSAGF